MQKVFGVNMIRNDKIDILKGIAIVLVVLGHTRFGGTGYIYLFHMAVFFMASGFFYKEKQSDSIKALFKSIKKRIVGIWLPFVVWNTAFTLLHNTFIRINVYTSDEVIRQYLDESLVNITLPLSHKYMAINIIKGFFLAGHTRMGGTFWFLRTLFYISVLYLCLDFIYKLFSKDKNKILITQGLVSAIFLIIGFAMQIIGFDSLGLDLMFSCYCLYYSAFLLGKFTPSITQKCNIIIYTVTAILCSLLLLLMSFVGEISLGSNYYPNPLFMLLASFFGWLMLYSISAIIELLAPVKTLFCSLGKNSLIIMIFHFLFFKPVSLLIAVVKGWPLQTIAGFPVSYNRGLWWIIYTIISIGLCMLSAYIWHKTKAFFRKNVFKEVTK